jgi:chromosome segregation ATPase
LVQQAAEVRKQLGQSKGLLEHKQNALAEANQKLEQHDIAIKEVREEAELTQLQLQQVQEELEHYFLHSRFSDQQVAAQAEQNGRAFSLLGRMLQLTTASGAWLPEIQPPPLSSRSKRSRLRWGR